MDLEVTLPSGGARRLHIPSLHDDITGATLRKKQVHMWGGGLGCLFALKCGLITSFFHSALYISLWDFQQCWPMRVTVSSRLLGMLRGCVPTLV